MGSYHFPLHYCLVHGILEVSIPSKCMGIDRLCDLSRLTPGKKGTSKANK